MLVDAPLILSEQTNHAFPMKCRVEKLQGDRTTDPLSLSVVLITQNMYDLLGVSCTEVLMAMHYLSGSAQSRTTYN